MSPLRYISAASTDSISMETRELVVYSASPLMRILPLGPVVSRKMVLIATSLSFSAASRYLIEICFSPSSAVRLTVNVSTKVNHSKVLVSSIMSPSMYISFAASASSAKLKSIEVEAVCISSPLILVFDLSISTDGIFGGVLSITMDRELSEISFEIPSDNTASTEYFPSFRLVVSQRYV